MKNTEDGTVSTTGNYTVKYQDIRQIKVKFQNVRLIAVNRGTVEFETWGRLYLFRFEFQ